MPESVPVRAGDWEQVIGFIAADKPVEAARKSLRLRKKVLQCNKRLERYANAST